MTDVTRNPTFRYLFLPVLALGLVAGCTPKVQVEAPKEPVTINLNVKIEREVRIKIEREVEDLLRDRKDLF